MKYVLSLMLLLLIQTPLYAQSLSATAERDIAISRQVINDKRNTALAFNMSFTEADAMSNVATRQLDVIVDYANHYENMTEDKAQELLDRSLIYEEQAIKVKQLYVDKFRRVLPNTKVTRLMQIESRMDTAIRFLSPGNNQKQVFCVQNFSSRRPDQAFSHHHGQHESHAIESPGQRHRFAGFRGT